MLQELLQLEEGEPCTANPCSASGDLGEKQLLPARLSIRACSGVAVSPLWQWVAVAEPVLAFLWHWAASATACCHPPYPVDLGGLLAFLLSVFSRAVRAACGCTTEIVVLQSLRFPDHLCVSRLEKTEEAERKRRVCV